jgi:hypothetical protein
MVDKKNFILKWKSEGRWSFMLDKYAKFKQVYYYIYTGYTYRECHNSLVSRAIDGGGVLKKN